MAGTETGHDEPEREGPGREARASAYRSAKVRAFTCR